ncbi:haloacid dehalogenase type II [Epibacterium ulvae]|uniref:haloacid dehalogenase type II n=1 Tax=Epibacterium ulvae TaxID=1156985 RepID=UPI002492A94A|nr:haloacid dehalogenase type II [Epibacterium ulvae]
MSFTTYVFDAYGTLFDVTAAARQAAQESEFPELQDIWRDLAQHWRTKQLQYTWLRAVTHAHTDFWEVTENGLDWALEATGLANDAALRKRLLDLYWHLQAYPEVPALLETLKTQGHKTAILSNGSMKMLGAASRSAGIAHHLDALLSVDTVGVFKPDARVYDLVEAHFGCTKQDVLFVSSNGWDAGCATGYGFTTAWVNRSAEPIDRLPWRPHHILTDLTTIPDLR